ncbi:hypothetical protein CC2G_006863 [Coprinopsis cinerea AmutBmut pab1-1]|nr:hypothetical protein CC2G_006863 [Coprinopsis cinerea AmutBmut pab1-1]
MAHAPLLSRLRGIESDPRSTQGVPHPVQTFKLVRPEKWVPASCVTLRQSPGKVKVLNSILEGRRTEGRTLESQDARTITGRGRESGVVVPLDVIIFGTGFSLYSMASTDMGKVQWLLSKGVLIPLVQEPNPAAQVSSTIITDIVLIPVGNRRTPLPRLSRGSVRWLANGPGLNQRERNETARKQNLYLYLVPISYLSSHRFQPFPPKPSLLSIPCITVLVRLRWLYPLSVAEPLPSGQVETRWPSRRRVGFDGRRHDMHPTLHRSHIKFDEL